MFRSTFFGKTLEKKKNFPDFFNTQCMDQEREWSVPQQECTSK